MKCLVVCTTDSMIWNFLIPHINLWKKNGITVDVACSKTGFYFDELKEKFNFNMNEFSFTRSPFSLSNIKAFFKLKKFIKNENYDVVISQEPVGGVLGRIAGKLNGCKNVYTAHGFHFYKGAPLKNWLIYYPVEKFLSRITDVLISINEEDFLISKTFKAKKIFKIPGIGVDLNRFDKSSVDKFAVREQLGFSNDEKIILTVAEMIPRKNYETALKALSLIKDLNFKYVICGDGILTDSLKKLAEDYGISEKIVFAGFRKDVNLFYSIADLFLFPSFQEGLSIALIEAMASGLPIVCSKIRGNTDLIQEKKGGVLYSPLDYVGFAGAIKEIIENVHSDYGEFNRNFVKQFSFECSSNELFSILKEVE